MGVAYRRARVGPNLAPFILLSWISWGPGVLEAGQVPPGIPPEPAKPAAFTAVQELRYFRTDGSPEGPPSIRVQAFRENGDRALTVSRNGDPNPTRTLVLAGPKVEYVIDPVSRTFLKSAARARLSLREACAHNPCEKLDTPVLGYGVVRITSTVPGGLGLTETLAAPVLNYFPLRVILKTASGQVISTEETVSVRLGEPDPGLFALPPEGYAESKDRKQFIDSAVRGHGFGPQ